MTTQPAELIDTDTISHLDWHETRRCEHRGHGHDRKYHLDGGELYVEIHCTECEHEPYVKVLCATYIGMAYSGKFTLYCDCGYRTTEATDFYQILGPAN